MKPVGTWRGQPLVAMAFVVIAWIAVRMMMWQAGVEPPLPGLSEPAAASRLAGTPRPVSAPAAISPPPFTAMDNSPRGDPVTSPFAVAPSIAPAIRAKPVLQPAVPAAIAPAASPARWTDALPAAPMPVPSAVEPAPVPASDASTSTLRRWSADSWLMVREGGGAALGSGAAAATYGASQAGAVLRYRLAPGDPHRPAVYLRATAALNGSREKELATGFSARPLTGLPVIAAAELRAMQQSGRTRLRPAAMLISEVPPIALPKGLRAELYAQAGYVGGRFATPFADGQLRIDHVVAAIGRGELRAGAGSWGGAQKGVARADVGPGATLALPVGATAAARLALDWRLRVAGNAAPSSGPTVTLSAGF